MHMFNYNKRKNNGFIFHVIFCKLQYQLTNQLMKWNSHLLKNNGQNTLRSISSRCNMKKYSSRQKSLSKKVFQIQSLGNIKSALRTTNHQIDIKNPSYTLQKNDKITKLADLENIGGVMHLTPQQKLNIKAKQLQQVAKYLKVALKDIKNDLLNIVQSFQCMIETKQIEALKQKIHNEFQNISAHVQQEPDFLDEFLNEHSTIQRLSRKQKMTESVILSKKKNNQFFLPIGNRQNKLTLNSDRSFNDSFMSCESNQKNLVIKVLAPPTRDKQLTTKRSVSSAFEKSKISGAIQSMKSILQLENQAELIDKKMKHKKAPRINPKFVL